MQAPRSRLAIDRAVAELRAGRAVALLGEGGPLLVAAAEQLAPEMLASMREAGETLLVLTRRRAAVLRIQPSFGEDVVVPLPADADAPLVRSLADPTQDLSNPLRGPFPRLKAPQPAALRAAVPLLRLARLLPAATVAKARAVADDVLSVDAADILALKEGRAGLAKVVEAPVPLADCENTRIVVFRPEDGGEDHLAIIVGDPPRDQPVLTRLHSACLTGDLLGSLKCDCGDQLRGAIAAIAKAGGGVLLYLAQEGRGIGIVNKLRAYALQDQGFDTVDANFRLGFESDERDFAPAAAMLRALGYDRLRLMTNNPDKVAGLAAEGLAVVERVPHAFPPNPHNLRYLETKAKKSGHLL